MQSDNKLYLNLDGTSSEQKRVTIDSSESKKYLEKLLPQCDRHEIPNELRKRFTLEYSKRSVPQRKAFPSKKGRLSYQETKDLHLRKLPKKGQNYQDYLPLNKLWSDYIQSYFSLNEIRNGGGVSEQGTLMLQKADYHGALIKVVRSKCSSLVGTKGIVLMDTKGTFQIICKSNIVKTIPKQSSVFEIYVEDITVTVFGKHFTSKPAERSTKKIKARLIKDLI